ncbi:zf-HC2 domain-containing protein [Aquimarina brevivitae]|uniref:Tetratricopeptide repeat protein n=1 Tax=Aquimarina brevivitae TaxID=323412 RepID=A0A4Q7P396_9FLAO|nr:zf-HC2 domain-containing protein [Aquimarina brevivitae]RZS93152.1 hypothetical protein EV197_1722 [Aquimarina brevivitae]
MKDVFEHIDRYLDGELTAAELERFEEELQLNPELQDQVKLEKDMRALLSDEDWILANKAAVADSEEGKRFKAYYQSTEADEVKNSIAAVIADRKNNDRRKFIWLSIAASFAVLLASTFVIFKDGGTSDLYAEYINKEELPSMITRNSGGGILDKAQSLFDNENYKEAIKNFENYQSQSEVINPLSYIYLGISYLEVGAYSKAKNQFNLLAKSNTLQSEKANWYLLLTSLKQGNRREAQQILNRILQSESSYHYDKALAIKKALE